MKRFLAALRFLTILPLPGTWGTSEADLAGSVAFFPAVGLLLGVAAAAVACGATQVAPPLVAAAAILVSLMAFSGCLHLDGLADTADAFLSSRSRERMLEIMKDSHTGAMGAAAIVMLLLTKFAALASLPTAVVWPAALLMPLAGRTAIVIHMALLPYVRPAGVGAVFYRQRPRWSALGAATLLAAVSWGVLGRPGLVVAAACLAAMGLLAVYVRHKIQGATGDTLGAACELLELVPPLTLSVWPPDSLRWP
jgi:adenosylcobinamide-GDP ribazoletransferase